MDGVDWGRCVIVSVNGFVLNDPTTLNGCYLDEPVDGLGLPQMRTSSGNLSGRHGGYVGAQFYGMRLITLTGRIFGSGTTAQAQVQAMDATRKSLAAAVSGQGPFALNITTNGGALYTLNVYLDQLDMPVSRTPNMCNYKLSLVAPDVNIYDNSAGGALSATLPRATSGGFAWPITWPIVWNPGSTATDIVNTGSVVVYPMFTLTGIMTNPTITNQTTGQFYTLQGLTTAATDVVTIDMKNRAVLLNDGSILPYMTSTSTWLALMTGDNSMTLQTTSSSDTVTCRVSWQAAYRGI